MNLRLGLEVFRRAKALINDQSDHYRQVMALQDSERELNEKKKWIADLKPYVDSIDQSILNGLASGKSLHAESSPSVRGANLYIRAIAARIYQAGRLVQHPSIAEKLEGNFDWGERVSKVCKVMLVTEQLLEQIKRIEDRLSYLSYVLGHLESNQDKKEAVLNEVASILQTISESLQECYDRLVAVPYPYNHSEQEKSVGDVLLPLLPDPNDLFDAAQKAANFADSFLQFRGRCIGTLVLVADKVEGVLEATVV